MCKIIEFKPKEIDEITINMPTKEEIDGLNGVVNLILKSGEQPDFRIWNGNCYKDFFNNVCMEYGEQNNLDPWDILAIIIAKANGVEFDMYNNQIRV